MLFPKDLVDKYGAKAGLLLYVKEHLPNIPQMPMVVKRPEESVDLIVDNALDLPYPLLVRSSAKEELDGYEGTFPTKIVYGGEHIPHMPDGKPPTRCKTDAEYLESVIQEVENSAQRLKENDQVHFNNLPDKISTIITPKSPSIYSGTFIKHPHLDDTYIITYSTVSYDNKMPKTTLIRQDKDIKIFEGFNVAGQYDDNWYDDIKKLTDWHDQIVKLPEIDDSWVYQIEFGLDPLCLYQVRPFYKKEKASFTLPKSNDVLPPVVFGITPEEGINVRTETNLSDRIINESINEENHPALFFEDLRNARFKRFVPNIQVSVLNHSAGLLEHNDIACIRTSQLSILYGNLDNREYPIQDAWYNVKSDGINVQVTPLE